MFEISDEEFADDPYSAAMEAVAHALKVGMDYHCGMSDEEYDNLSYLAGSVADVDPDIARSVFDAN